MSVYTEYLRTYVQQGDLSTPLDSILATLTAIGDKKNLLNLATMQKATLSRTINELHKGVLSQEAYNISLAKLTNAVLHIIDEMDREGIDGKIPKPPEEAISSPSDTKIKILFLGANPMDSTRLRIDKELRDIDTGLRMAAERDRIVLSQRWAVTDSVLQQALLDEEPTIVHFSGHGTDEGILLESEQGQSTLVPEDALADLFSLFSRHIRCVVLNACFSENQARAISESIPFVVGMNASMPDEAAIAFSIGFYRAIGAGKDVEFAFNLGRNAIKLKNMAGAEMAMLLKKPA